jgi:hypothetical protein
MKDTNVAAHNSLPHEADESVRVASAYIWTASNESFTVAVVSERGLAIDLEVPTIDERVTSIPNGTYFMIWDRNLANRAVGLQNARFRGNLAKIQQLV